MISEPGSPQALSQVSEEDVSMLSDEDGDLMDSVHSRIPRSAPPDTPWRSQLQSSVVSTPVLSPQLGVKAVTGHVRQRHPQENFSSDRLGIPSPVDEDEVATPPSAAEAAGSQLELLSFDDVDMQGDDALPRIAIESERSLQLDGSAEVADYDDQMDSTPDFTTAIKTRARSGALSAGRGSPLRDCSSPPSKSTFGVKRGFSMGFRADCEKCINKTPGHMNHLY